MNVTRVTNKLFQTKGSKSRTETDLALLELGLHCNEHCVRLISAAICISDTITEFQETSNQIFKKAILDQDIGGTFCQLLFWEALLNFNLSDIDPKLLKALAERSMRDASIDSTNTIAALRLLDLYQQRNQT